MSGYSENPEIGQLCPKLCPKLKRGVMVGHKSTSLTLQTHVGPVIFILARPTKNAQDLKSCEGSSPSPGTLLTGVSAKLSPPDSPLKYPNCAQSVPAANSL